MNSVRSSYLFETAAQWQACLFAGASHGPRRGAAFAPQAPYSRNAHAIASSGAVAPTFTPAGEVLWRDGLAHILRALPDDAAPDIAKAPWPVAQAMRMVVDADSLWVAGAEPGTLANFELDTLARRQVIEIAGARIIDLATDGRHGLMVLVERDGFEILQLGCNGAEKPLLRLDAGLVPTLMAWLPAQKHAVLLVDGGEALAAFEAGASSPRWTRRLAAFRPCFVGEQLASDGRGRLFVAGADGADFGSRPCALALDNEASLIDCLELTAPARGIAGARGLLVVAQEAGVEVFGLSDTTSDTTAVECELITPILTAPDSDSELRWQRAEAWASLPEGATLEMRYGWTEDPDLAARAGKIATDTRLPESQRLAWLLASVDHWGPTVAFAGSASRGVTDPLAPPLAFPLHDARAGSLWLHLRLRATPRSALPSLSRLSVSYAGSALLQQLPAVYRRTATKPGDFLGALVGTLEASSQDLDRRIAALGGLVHPDTAPAQWLDELAVWLGLPWNDALSLEQKRALVRHAGELAASRGTRAGLSTLLECLFPGASPRYRIVDLDVDYGFATLGGARCRGTSLPALLAGLPRSAAVLSRKAILGRAHLPCMGKMPSATRDLVGRLRVDVAVDAATRRGAERWLAPMIDSMVPANLRIELRWRAVPNADDPGGELLAPVPQPHLGRDAITGFARLPPGRAATHWP
jgi:phage tail-like protein